MKEIVCDESQMERTPFAFKDREMINDCRRELSLVAQNDDTTRNR